MWQDIKIILSSCLARAEQWDILAAYVLDQHYWNLFVLRFLPSKTIRAQYTCIFLPSCHQV